MKKKSMQVKFVPIINQHSRVLDDRLPTSVMLDILFDYICQTKNEKENSSQEQNLLPESKNRMLKG